MTTRLPSWMLMASCVPPVEVSRLRMYRTTKSSFSSHTLSPESVIPWPGAVCPAIVIFGLFTWRSLARWMSPEISNTMVRPEPGAEEIAWRSVPEVFVSSRLVTW